MEHATEDRERIGVKYIYLAEKTMTSIGGTGGEMHRPLPWQRKRKKLT
jgi:hypothetical protein